MTSYVVLDVNGHANSPLQKPSQLHDLYQSEYAQWHVHRVTKHEHGQGDERDQEDRHDIQARRKPSANHLLSCLISKFAQQRRACPYSRQLNLAVLINRLSDIVNEARLPAIGPDRR